MTRDNQTTAGRIDELVDAGYDEGDAAIIAEEESYT